MLKDEFQYYLDHQFELVKQYSGKYIVIKEKTVIGVYDTEFEAYNKTQEEHELGTFLIQLCTPGNEAFTQTFHSRVIFA
jgi:hypothetical protein